MVWKADKELPARFRQRGHPLSSGGAGRAAEDPSRGPPAPSQLASREAWKCYKLAAESRRKPPGKNITFSVCSYLTYSFIIS